MGCLNRSLHSSLKRECRLDNCGFYHTPADDFVKSQWQNRTKSVAYLIYRWLIALFFTAVVIDSVIDHIESTNFWLYFIYMTNWGIILCMLTNLLIAVLVTIWHYYPEYADKLLNMKSLSCPFRIYWAMHIIALVLSVVITIIYWSLLYNASESMLDATNILTHAFNSICMFIDLLIVAHPLRLLHMLYPVIFGTVYAIFSLIYQKCGGLNKKGMPYIYHVLDWNQPKCATLTFIGVLLLTCIVYSVLFFIYKLRTLFYRRIHTVSYILPTTTDGNVDKDNTNEKSNGIQHSPSGISMVLSDYIGYQNQGFSSSNDNVSKK